MKGGKEEPSTSCIYPDNIHGDTAISSFATLIANCKLTVHGNRLSNYNISDLPAFSYLEKNILNRL